MGYYLNRLKKFQQQYANLVLALNELKIIKSQFRSPKLPHLIVLYYNHNF